MNLFDCMDKEEISELEAVLVEFLDEDIIFGSQEELDPAQVPRYKPGLYFFYSKTTFKGTVRVISNNPLLYAKMSMPHSQQYP